MFCVTLYRENCTVKTRATKLFWNHYMKPYIIFRYRKNKVPERTGKRAKAHSLSALARSANMFFVLLAILNVDVVRADCIRDRGGDVVCALGACERDRKGDVFCTGLGGGIAADDRDRLFCGIGQCRRDRDGDIWCSIVQGGGAATDSRGEVKCYGGCERGRQKLCKPGKSGK
uniref:Uncharacterized protein n=1 Tax=Candidatus Kentrum sp. UNK TaxID=2126344 RepID=A0A451AMM8_9GAMM|nr:MAG: hypothetical protein BECKUNK1418G_GA0071005_11337 [Candidatus Kentron sp. UNK]VFK72611.1 MAG: hypothetical protein BECKUNK1418H_GA0071006_11257 [Candidatus Kentron sp. UNK]